MTIATRLAVLSPRDNLAGILSDDRQTVSVIGLAADCVRELDVGQYFARFPDTLVADVSDNNVALDQLARSRDQSMALDLMLLLFDNSITTATRKDIAHELDELLRAEECRNYVLDILFAAPLPASADYGSVAAATSDWPFVSTIVGEIIECQNRIRFAHESWLQMRTNAMVQAKGIDRVRGSLIANGVFRRLVGEARTKCDVERIRPSIVLDRTLGQSCDARVIVALIASYASHLPGGGRNPELRISRDAEAEDIAIQETMTGRIARPSNTAARADERRDQAERQVEKIAELFGQGADVLATQGLSASQAIRDYCRDNPDRAPKEVAAEMVSRGFTKVTAGYVSTIMSLAKKAASEAGPSKPETPASNGGRKRGRKPTGTTSSGSTAFVGPKLTVEALIQAKKLTDDLGGVAKALAALDAIAKLGG